MWLTHYIQLKKIKGASSLNTTLTTQDLDNLADRVWDHMITSTWQARVIMEMLPSMLATNTENNQIAKMNQKQLAELKELILTYPRN